MKVAENFPQAIAAALLRALGVQIPIGPTNHFAFMRFAGLLALLYAQFVVFVAELAHLAPNVSS